MINLTKELKMALSTQDVYDIISFSVDAADDNGFMNSFIFNRALYLFAAIVLYPDQKEEYASIVAANINQAWDKMVEEGIIQQMMDDYPEELKMLAENGKQWFDEYSDYAQSARGLLNTIQDFSGDIVKSAVEQLKNASQEAGVKEVLDIADKWGMNNELGKEEKEEVLEEKSPDSLFE